MRIGAIVAVLLCAVSALLVAVRGQTAQQQSACCVLAQQALADVGAIKVGMLRKELEPKFALDGGLTLRGRTIYVYRMCPYMKVQVDFASDPKVEGDLSPEDTIKKVSKIFLEYPVRD